MTVFNLLMHRMLQALLSHQLAVGFCLNFPPSLWQHLLCQQQPQQQRKESCRQVPLGDNNAVVSDLPILVVLLLAYRNTVISHSVVPECIYKWQVLLFASIKHNS